MNKRIHYIDNLRWLTVSLLILYHAAMAYNTWGEPNYIFFKEVKIFAAFVSFVSPWFMPIMFLLAGVSARYSIQKRGIAQFIKERFFRLGIPFVFGEFFICPILSYIADVSHNGYSDGFFAHFGIYFSRFTDLSGYDGGFTLGHFWFLAVLMIISILSCAVIKLIGRADADPQKLLIIGLVLACVAAGAFDVNILGKRVVTYMCVYLLGYYFFSQPEYVHSLTKHKWLFTWIFLGANLANTVIFIFVGGLTVLNNICNYASFVFAVPALMTLAHDHLDFSNRVTALNSRISYVFYIIHFPITVLAQYLLAKTGVGAVLNLPLTLIIAYPLTYALCVAVDKTRYLRVLFGSKSKPNRIVMTKSSPR